jgi:outer membrane protein assembly factor BamB
MLRLIILSITVFASSAVLAAEWSQFRGPGGNGSSDEAAPISWGANKNIVWKTKLTGRGASSPIVWRDRIFLTGYSGYGISNDENATKADLKLHVMSFDRNTGSQLWNKSIAASESTQKYGKRVADHGYATSTPVTDGEAVYGFFGVSGVVAYDFDGNLLWQAQVGDKTAGFGSASSPVLHENLIIVNASIESGTVFAFDKKTGKEAWKIEEINKAWTSPCLAQVGDSTELIINQKETIYGFDPATGKKLWWCKGIEDYVVPVPVHHDGVVYCLGGRSNRSIAIKLGGRGDVTESHKLWHVNIGANVTSPVFYDGRIYCASDKGVAFCLDAKTGEEVYRERIPTRSRIYASIIRSGKHFYVTTRDAGIIVLEATPEYKEVGINKIEDDENLLNASPAVDNNQLLIRSDSYLYCIGATK